MRRSEGRTRTELETERTHRTKRDGHTTITEVPPVTPVPSVRPVVIHDAVTNVVERPVPVAEGVNVRVISLEYDAAAHVGILTVEIVSGSFIKANAYIRTNIAELVRRQSLAEGAKGIPPTAMFEIESISVNERNLCEVKFKAKAG